MPKTISPVNQALIVGFLNNQRGKFEEWLRANGHSNAPFKAQNLTDDLRMALDENYHEKPRTVIVLKGGLVHRLYSDFKKHKVTVMDIDEQAEDIIHTHHRKVDHQTDLDDIIETIHKIYTEK